MGFRAVQNPYCRGPSFSGHAGATMASPIPAELATELRALVATLTSQATSITVGGTRKPKKGVGEQRLFFGGEGFGVVFLGFELNFHFFFAGFFFQVGCFFLII